MKDTERGCCDTPNPVLLAIVFDACLITAELFLPGNRLGQFVENYRQLWRVKQAFRISKTDLRIRPMYHRRRRRIEAHILIVFVAYTIQKELERRLVKAKLPLTPGRVAELTQAMYEMAVRLPDDPELLPVLLQMDSDQQQIYDLLH